ncbi:MAG: phosphoribosylformylglycinamidine synthase subunit PurS [Myxococcales bacterium]|nr:phosphoribosylformylglycinamidine synthase subunit PurS [Myxococcales bacterium]
MTAKVYVTLKRGVLDPQGQAVAHALGRLGFAEAKDARIGKYIELTLDGGGSREEVEKRVDKMCRDLLANLVIEEYRFELVD